MSNNLTLQTTALATPPSGSVVETEDQGAGVQRQVVKVGNAVAVTGTFWQATQPVSGTFWQATQPISLSASANKWKAGASAGWASAFGSEVNSVASGSSILSTVIVSNSTGLDQYIDISVSLGSITSGAGSPYVGFYLYPLNQDGTTYGDGRYGSAVASQPLVNYSLGALGLIPSVTQVQTGTVVGSNQNTPMTLPPGDFKLVMFNLAGATLAGSANTIKYRTYNSALQ